MKLIKLNESIKCSKETVNSMVAQLAKNIEDYKTLMAYFPEDSDYWQEMIDKCSDYWQEMIDKCQAEIDKYSSYEPLSEDYGYTHRCPKCGDDTGEELETDSYGHKTFRCASCGYYSEDESEWVMLDESINSGTTYNIDDYSPKAIVAEITAKVKDPNVSFIKLYYKSRYGNGCTCFKRNGDSWLWVNDKGLVMNHGTVNEKNSLNLSDSYVVKQLVYSLRNNNCTKLVVDTTYVKESLTKGMTHKSKSKSIKESTESVKKLREASNSSRFDEDKADYNYELESGGFWDSRTTPKATTGRIADILLKVKDYLAHYYGDEGLYYFDNDFLPKAVDSGINYGIDSDKLRLVKNWFDSGMPDDWSKKIWNESLYKSKSKSINEDMSEEDYD